MEVSSADRDLLIKRLASCGLPSGEIVRITGTSGRTVARTLQRLGLKRSNQQSALSFIQRVASRKRHSLHLTAILTRYYSLEEITLDSLHQLACENGLSLKKLFDLIREHVSPSRWAIRPCLGPCGQPALTSSPADRYCPRCKKKVDKSRKDFHPL
jgi:hypothetical protein